MSHNVRIFNGNMYSRSQRHTAGGLNYKKYKYKKDRVASPILFVDCFYRSVSNRRYVITTQAYPKMLGSHLTSILCICLKNAGPSKLSKNKQKSACAIVSINAFMVLSPLLFRYRTYDAIKRMPGVEPYTQLNRTTRNAARERMHFETMAVTVVC